jgi:hypothetical protein
MYEKKHLNRYGCTLTTFGKYTSNQSFNTSEVSSLTLEDVPPVDAPFGEIYNFAHSINGYELAGSFEAAVDISNDESKTDLLSLRVKLFFSARAHRHVGLHEDSPDMRTLVKQIRDMVHTSAALE